MSQYKRKDSLHQRAKREGYRSRAAYKLIELDKKYHLLRTGQRVIDLGAWPGGWLQVCAKRVGSGGRVVGIDLVEIDSLKEPHVLTVTGDVRDEEHLTAATDFAEGPFDLVLSDMSPKHTGIKEVDHIATVASAELAMWAADKLLKPKGAVVIKLFPSNEAEQFVKSMRARFNKLARTGLKATRKSSNEFYLIGLGFKSALK